MKDQTFNENHHPILKKVEALMILMIFIFGYGMLAIGAWHTYPNAEEFELSAAPRDVGIIRSLVDLMISYDGRYATNIMHALNPLTLNSIYGYKLMPVLSVFIFVVGLYLFLIPFINSQRGYNIFLLSALFTLPFFASLPSLVCSLYWVGGAFVYLYPCIFFMLFAASLISYVRCERIYENLYFLISVLSLIGGIGFNEMFLPFYSISLTVLLYFFWHEDQRIFFKILPVTIIGYTSILFFVFTPGVSFRLENSEATISMQLFSNNFKNLFITLFEAVSKPITFCIFLYTAVLFNQNVIYLKRNISLTHSIYFIIGILSIAYLMAFAYYFPKRELSGYPERIYPPILFLCLFTFFLLSGKLISISNRTRSSLLLKKILPYLKPTLLVIILFNMIFGNNNIALLFSDFRSRKMQHFKDFMDSRICKLTEASQLKGSHNIVLIPKLDEDGYPTSIYKYPDVEVDRQNSIWNKYHEEYFKIDEIIVSGDTSNRFK